MEKRVFIFLAVLGTLLASCTKDKCINEMSYEYFKPVYVQPDSIPQDIEVKSPQQLENPGKIYFYKNYIFINEPREGFHVINNEDPNHPINEKFIAITGNVDLAVKDDILYADAYSDLVSITVSNMNDIKQVNRKKNVFNSYYHALPSGVILSHYEKTTEKIILDCSNPNFGRGYFFSGGGIFCDASINSLSGNQSFSSTVAPSQVGMGGSMARITITHGHLYAIGSSEIFAIALKPNGSVSDPVKTTLPWGIETIFPYKNYLFIGAQAGMHMLSLDDPLHPAVSGTFSHARACDPVVVKDDIAYVTLRDGNTCAGFVNQLDVIDVKEISNPKLLYSYKMEHPHGLAVDSNYLYLCEGKHGLKVFDISNIAKISENQIGLYDGFHAWDAISLTGHSLLVIGEDGFRQYDHSDPKKLKLLSKIGKK